MCCNECKHLPSERPSGTHQSAHSEVVSILALSCSFAILVARHRCYNPSTHFPLVLLALLRCHHFASRLGMSLQHFLGWLQYLRLLTQPWTPSWIGFGFVDETSKGIFAGHSFVKVLQGTCWSSTACAGFPHCIQTLQCGIQEKTLVNFNSIPGK